MSGLVSSGSADAYNAVEAWILLRCSLMPCWLMDIHSVKLASKLPDSESNVGKLHYSFHPLATALLSQCVSTVWLMHCRHFRGLKIFYQANINLVQLVVDSPTLNITCLPVLVEMSTRAHCLFFVLLPSQKGTCRPRAIQIFPPFAQLTSVAAAADAAAAPTMSG